MKTLKVKSILFSLLTMMAVAVFMTSCEQEAIQIGDSLESTIPLDNIRVENNDGILKFEGGEKFFDEFEQLNNATTEELITFTDALGFKSYLSAVNDAHAELETVSTPEEMAAFENTYSHLFTFENDQITEKIENLAYAAITTVDGFVLIGNYAMKVETDRVIEELTGDLKRLRKLDPLSDLSKMPNINILHTNVMNKNACPNSNTTYRETSDRRVDFSIRISNATCGCGIYRTIYTIKAEGYKKPRRKWKSYKTHLLFRCVNFTVEVNGTMYSVSGISKDQDNVKEIVRSGYISPTFLYPPIYRLNKVRGKATSRGIGHRWAVICCGYNSEDCYSTTANDCY